MMIKIPTVGTSIATLKGEADELIAALSNSRRYGAIANLRSWRKIVYKTDPAGKQAKHFVGEYVDPGEEVDLIEGIVLVALDTIYIKANFYAADRRSGVCPESELCVRVFQVHDGELIERWSESSRKFKTWHLRAGREAMKLSPKGSDFGEQQFSW